MTSRSPSRVPLGDCGEFQHVHAINDSALGEHSDKPRDNFEHSTCRRHAHSVSNSKRPAGLKTEIRHQRWSCSSPGAVLSLVPRSP